jgi:hypothetical protein
MRTLLVLAALSFSSCIGIGIGGDDDDPECVRDRDCDDDEICEDDECIAAEGEGEREPSDDELVISSIRYRNTIDGNQAGSNQRFVLVTGTLENTTADDLPLGFGFFTVTTESSLVFFASSLSDRVADPCPDAAALAPGGTTPECTIAYEIPADDDAAIAAYDDESGHRFEATLPEPDTSTATCPVTPSASDEECAVTCQSETGDGAAESAFFACANESECTFDVLGFGTCGDISDMCACMDESDCTDCLEQLTDYVAVINLCNDQCGTE